MCYLVAMRLHLGRKRKPPIVKGKQHHIRISQQGFERLEACFKASGLKTRRQMLDNLVLGYSVNLGVEPGLQKHWRKAGKRKKASKARRDGRQE